MNSWRLRWCRKLSRFISNRDSSVVGRFGFHFEPEKPASVSTFFKTHLVFFVHSRGSMSGTLCNQLKVLSVLYIAIRSPGPVFIIDTTVLFIFLSLAAAWVFTAMNRLLIVCDSVFMFPGKTDSLLNFQIFCAIQKHAKGIMNL